jgi:methylglutaconyl-CoA hydratase
MDIRARSDAGKPVVATMPDSVHAQIYRDIAAKTWAEVQAAAGKRIKPPAMIISPAGDSLNVAFEGSKPFDLTAEMLRVIYECPKPTIARVQGDCYAGGMGLVSACDVVVAAEPVNFCLSEAKLGLLPATIAPYVVKAMGEQAARRYFVTAERFDARRAERLGLVHECVPAEQLDDAVEALVQAICANGPAAVKACKQLVKDVASQPVTDALRAETARRIADIRASSEGREGVASFLEKRKPQWLNESGDRAAGVQ